MSAGEQDNAVSRNSDQYPMRLPEGLRDRVKAEAKKNRRSMNAEFVARVEASFGGAEQETLRDLFAATALEGLLSNSEGVHASAEPTLSALSGDRGHCIAEWLAAGAYRLADAMLAERSK